MNHLHCHAGRDIHRGYPFLNLAARLDQERLGIIDLLLESVSYLDLFLLVDPVDRGKAP